LAISEILILPGGERGKREETKGKGNKKEQAQKKRFPLLEEKGTQKTGEPLRCGSRKKENFLTAVKT
jgi:hypothetical protein